MTDEPAFAGMTIEHNYGQILGSEGHHEASDGHQAPSILDKNKVVD
jgi:hypothetical protein